MKSKILVMILLVVIMMNIFAITTTSYAETISDSIGTKVNATFNDETKALTIFSTTPSVDGKINKTLFDEFMEKIGKTNVQTLSIMNKVYAPENSNQLFYNFSNLTNIDNMHNFDTSKVTSMRGMFWNCSSLESLDVSSFNASNVTNMDYMFTNCSSLKKLDVRNLNTSNVTTMSKMFWDCSKIENLDLSSFNTEKVTDMSIMFWNCSSLKNLDISSFNTSNVTTMNGMFTKCSSLLSLNLNSFNTQNVTDMEHMFQACSSLTALNLSKFNTSNVTNMGDMFTDCKELRRLDVSGFNTSNVTNMDAMFWNCENLSTLNLSNFDTSKANASASNMLTGCFGLINFYTPYPTINITLPDIYCNLSDQKDNNIYESFGNNTFGKSVYLIKGQRVTLNTNGGTVNRGFVEGYIPGVGVTLPTDVTKEGYIFEGWYNNKSLVGTPITKIEASETGNKVFYAKWRKAGEVPEEELIRIKAGTNATALINSITLNVIPEEMKVLDLNNQQIASSALVGTGYKLEITYNGNKYYYNIVAKGDLNGDGKVTVTDLSIMNQALVNKITLADLNKLAADLDGNNNLTVTDLSIMNQALVGKINL